MKVIKKDISTEQKLAKLMMWAGLVKDSSDEDMAIELLVRQRYSMSQETALHRKKLMGVVAEDEWNEYVAYIEECKESVRNGMSKEGEDAD